jgi:thiamine pyrophosphate-dependent acetolactate synthase large subunit-like protein
MTPGLPFAIAAQLANPGRQVVAIVGDGEFAMLMAELSTAVKNCLPVKVVVLLNDMLAEVVFEQKELGNPRYGASSAASISHKLQRRTVRKAHVAPSLASCVPHSPRRSARRALPYWKSTWILPNRFRRRSG